MKRTSARGGQTPMNRRSTGCERLCRFAYNKLKIDGVKIANMEFPSSLAGQAI